MVVGIGNKNSKRQEEDDIEFEALAIESLAKKPPPVEEDADEFEALALESLAKNPIPYGGGDPFDTSSVRFKSSSCASLDTAMVFTESLLLEKELERIRVDERF